MTTAPTPKKTNPLMIVVIVAAVGLFAVVFCGILSAIAIPSFTGYLQRSKTTEANQQLLSMFSAAAAYYAEEHPGPNGVLTHCVVDSARSSNTPSSSKSVVAQWPESFVALGVTPADPIYYQYEIVSVGGCGHSPGASLYSFRAHGDLDGDGEQSLFEIASGDQGGELFRAPGIYANNELE